MELKLEKLDSKVQRVVDGEVIVGFAMKLSSGRWGATDTEATLLTRKTFETASAVLGWFGERARPDTEPPAPSM